MSLANISRRGLLGGVGAVALASAGLVKHYTRGRASVFIARHQTYEGDLTRTIREGLLAAGVSAERVRGKRVLLKPNMVEEFE